MSSPAAPRREVAPLLAAAAIVCTVTAVDAILGERVVLVGLLICAPLLCGLTTSPAATRGAGAVVVLVALAAFLWNDNLGSWTYWVPLTVVTLGSTFAYLTARYRERLDRDRKRMRVLAEVSEIAHGDRSARETAEAIAAIVAPAMFDFCLIDAVRDGNVERLAGPADFDATGDRAASVPLVAGERAIGRMTVGAPGGRRLDDDDVRYLETLAGRVGLAIGHAQLASELSSAEVQLQTILATVDAAIMVRDVRGRLVYANQAAADLLRFPDADALRDATSEDLMGRFEVYSEVGEPVGLDDLPGTRVLRGEPHPEPIVVRNVVKATGEERWLLNKATAITGDGDRPLMAVNLIEDITEPKRNEFAQRVLAGAARQVAGARDLPATMQALADAVVPSVADWAAVDVVGEGGRIDRVALAHRDPEKVRIGWELWERWPADPNAPDGQGAVIRSGEPQFVDRIDEQMLRRRITDEEHLAAVRALGLRSSMVVPLRAGDEVVGTLTLVSATSRRFDARDLALAQDLGGQAGMAIKNVQLNEERARIAHTLQASLLPDVLPDLAGWEVSGIYRAAGKLNEVGGDFYDVLPFGGGFAVVVGDVVGKGAEAAAVTALVRHTLAVMLESGEDLAGALAMLNRRLGRRRDRLPTLCTLAVLTVGAGDLVTVSSAGHPLPLLCRDGEVTPVGRTSPMLGVADRVAIRDATFRVLPGDQLLLYTDGVIDALGNGGRFGERRLEETLSSLCDRGAEAVAREVMGSIDAFATGDQTDDIAILSLTRTAMIAAQPSRAA